MNRNLYEVILKFGGSVGERLFNLFAYDHAAVLTEVKRLYPSLSEEKILISVAVGGYHNIESDYPNYRAVD